MADTTIVTKEELDHQFSVAMRKSSKKLTDDLKNTESAYLVHETNEADSFMGSTVSWYNWYLRQANTFVIILVVLCQYLNSYLFFFDSNQIFYNISVSADFLYTFIMFMQARTGHMIDGVEERNLLKVRDRYHRSLQFYLDIAGFLPINFLRFLVPGDDGPFYVAARQKAYVRMYYVLYYLNIREEEPGSSTVVYRSLKYTLLSTLLIHFLACGWYGLACSRAGSEGFSLGLCRGDSWIMILPQDLQQRIEAATTSVRGARDQVSFLHNAYITSLYWSSATTTSTGYGDIHAYTLSEKIYSIFAMILGMAILYGMTMGGFTSMLTNIDARRSSYVHQYNAFKQEVNSMGVSTEVKDLCLCYFDYLWHRWGGEDVQNSGVLEILPPSLQTSFSEATFKHLIQKADLLQSTEEAFRRNLSLVSKSMVYLENQYIQRSGEIASEMCYIQSGIVEVLDSEEKNVVAVLNEGKLFGQILLVFDLPRINSIRCRTNCDIFVLEKQNFRQVLSEYPEATKQFVEAARLKCDDGGKQWPMKAPSLSDFRHSTEKTNIRNRRRSVISQMISDVDPEYKIDDRRLTSVASNLDFTSARRMTTVCSMKYEGVDLSRVIMNSNIREHQEIQDNIDEGTKPSFVDFVLHGKMKRKTGPRSSTKLFDGTELIAENANVKDIKDAVGKHVELEDPDKTTMLERLASIVQIDPEGKFYRFWRTYLFYMSVFAGIYTTVMVFFATTPGMEKAYNGAVLASLPLLSIAAYSGEFTDVAVLQDCGTSSQDQLIGCLKGLNSSFSNRITGDDNNGYNVTVPGSYDVSFSGYNIETNGGILQIVIAYVLVDLSFYLNILINLRTAVKTPNGILTSFKDTKSYYMKWNRFGLDLISVFPLEILAALFPLSRLGQYHLWIYFRLNRAINYIRFVPTQFSKWEYSLDVQIVQIRIIKFVVYIYTFTHLCSGFFYWWSCSYIIQSDQTMFPTKCRIGTWAWVYNRDFNTDSFDDYIKTMYWASTTLTGTGYGDISASTTTGRMFALITMIIGTLLYGWLIAVIASTVSNSQAAIVSFMNSIESTKQYLQVHGVPDCLVNRVLDCRFLEWYRYRGTAIPGIESIGRELPDALHGALLYESVHKFVKSLPFFYEIDSSFIAMLCGYTKSYHYSAGDVVIYEGDLSRNLCVIKQGHCFTVTSDMMHTIDHLRAGDYFGETELLFGCGSPRTVIADTSCEIIVFTREDIDKVLCSFSILQSQMEKIEKNETYRKNILDAIASRKANAKLGMDMSKRFSIETINCGITLYGHKVDAEPLVNKMSEDHKCQIQQRTEMNPFLRFLSFCLLPFTFTPSNRSYIIYECIRCVLIVVTLFIVPLQAAMLPNNVGLLCVQYLLDFLCFIDQIIKLHTVYYNEKHIAVYNPYQTALNYLKTSFFIDFISWFPFEVFAMAAATGPWTVQQWKFFATLRFTKVLQVYKVNKYFYYWMDDVRCQRRWIKHLSSVLYGLIIHHWMGCLLFLTACPPDFYQKTDIYADQSLFLSLNATAEPMYCHTQSWLGKIVTDDTKFPSLQLGASYTKQYIVSIYWATATLVCVGYGDIHAERLAEMFIATLVMISGTVYYSSILGEVAANIQTDDMQRGHYKGRLSDILKFFKVYHVDKETQKQVINYYCYLWDRTQGVSPSDLLKGLPPSIRTSVCQSMYHDMIKEAFLQGDKGGSDEDQKERDGFFRLVTTRIQPCLFMKESVICRRGDVGEEMYFIQRGNVAIMDADDENIAVVLGPGQHFGEVALLFASPRARTIVALTNCDLNVLSKRDLDQVLDKFPKFRDQMTSIAEDRRVAGSSSTTYTHPSSKSDVTMDIEEVDETKTTTEETKKQRYLNLKIFDKESRFSHVCCHITIVLSFISACISIYQPCFQSHSAFLYTIGYLIDIWFIAEMVISYHTSYLDKFSTNVIDRVEVHAHYAKDPRKFLFDAIINCPLEIFAHAVSSPGSTSLTYAGRFAWISYLRVIRVLRMLKLLSICKMLEKDIRTDALAVRMYKFLLTLVFLLHSAACMWYFVACPGGRCGEYSWVSTSETDYITLGIMGYNSIPLIDSWYWATATMTSTGYGDIHPETLLEMSYSCLVMVGGKLVLGYVLGMVAATLANDESLRVWYEQRVASVKNYMTDLKFDQGLFDHVIQYYDYMWMKNQGVDVMKLFPDLPFGLCADIYNQICRKMVDALELFEGTSDNFRRHLCMVLHSTSFMPGDYICMQGDIRSEMYIVHRGVAESLKGDEFGNKVLIKLVQEGECFQPEGVLSKVRVSYSLRARTYVDVFTMNMSDLQGVIKYHPGAREKIIENAQRLYPESKV